MATYVGPGSIIDKIGQSFNLVQLIVASTINQAHKAQSKLLMQTLHTSGYQSGGEYIWNHQPTNFSIFSLHWAVVVDVCSLAKSAF